MCDTKQDPEAVCEFCLRHPQKIEHYFWCPEIIQRYGWIWAEVMQLVEEPELFERCLINPRFRAQFLLNPEAAALCEFAIHRDQDGYRRIKELTRLYILYVHKARKRWRQEMIQQGMNLPPHRPPNIDKPEQIPNKIKETWDSILQFNRIQRFPYPNLEMGRIEWNNKEIVQYQYLPIEVRKEWSRILANKHRPQISPAAPLYLYPQHEYHGLVLNNQQHNYHGLVPSNQQHQWMSSKQFFSYLHLIPLDFRTLPGMNSQLRTNYVMLHPTYLWPQYNNLHLWPWIGNNLQCNSPYLLQDRWPL